MKLTWHMISAVKVLRVATRRVESMADKTGFAVLAHTATQPAGPSDRETGERRGGSGFLR